MTPHRLPHPPRRAQRGISLFGLLFWAMVVCFAGYISVLVFPTALEYFTIKRALDQIAAEAPATVPDVRSAFERQRAIEYSISSITGQDLDVTKENDRLVIRFAYEKEIPVAGPVYLLLKYQGSSRP